MDSQRVDILLLETPFMSQTGNAEVRAYVQSKYNLALLALGSYLRAKSSHRVALINMVKDRIREDALVERLRTMRPRVIGVPLYSYNLSESYQIITRVRHILPNAHICVGGPHCSMFPLETIGLDAIDSMVLGDGEEPFLQICNQVLANGRLDDAALPPGTATKSSISAVGLPKPWSAPDLDALPMPDLSLLGDYRRYRDFLSNRVMAILTTSRGCPYKCHYCSSESSKYRAFSVDRVIEIMRHYMEQGVEYIEFWDETFNPNKRRLNEFADALLAAGLNIPWGIRGSVVLHVPIETMRKLKRGGLRVIQFGVETSQPRLAAYLNKHIDRDSIRDAFRTCERAGVRAVANLMVNIPGTTRREMLNDLEFLKDIRATYISVSVYNWAPGTTHYARALAEGVLDRDHWRAYAIDPRGEEPVLHANTEVPIDEVYRIRDRFVWGFYFNPSYILRYMRRMERCEFRQALGIFALMARSRAAAVWGDARRWCGGRMSRGGDAATSAKTAGRSTLVRGLPEDSHEVRVSPLSGTTV